MDDSVAIKVVWLRLLRAIDEDLANRDWMEGEVDGDSGSDESDAGKAKLEAACRAVRNVVINKAIP